MIASMGALAQIRQRQEMNDIAWRTANARVHGFRASYSAHQSQDIPVTVGKTASFPKYQNNYVNTRQGDVVHTNHKTHIAVLGEGFFNVQDPQGRNYITRRGDFKLGSNGELITSEGFSVLDIGGGPVIIPPEDIDFTVNADGSIATSNGVVSQLGIMGISLDDLANLPQVEGAYFLINDANMLTPLENPRVHQGGLEQSNVIVVQETASMSNLSTEGIAVKKMIEQTYEARQQNFQSLGKLG